MEDLGYDTFDPDNPDHVNVIRTGAQMDFIGPFTLFSYPAHPVVTSACPPRGPALPFQGGAVAEFTFLYGPLLLGGTGLGEGLLPF
eukprot:9723415-Karenia_brevis.AAC.1